MTKRNNSENKRPIEDTFYIVGVGTSAGGLEALTSLLGSFDDIEHNVCIIVVQHLSPNYKSELTAILAKKCKWPVVTAEDGKKLQPFHIYVTPQNKNIYVGEDSIKLTQLSAHYNHAPSIDDFLTSLANTARGRAIGIILSGTGKDGALGIKAIKENGGLALAQSLDSAQYDNMPMAAIDTNMVDMVIPPGEMYEEIIDYVSYHKLVNNSHHPLHNSLNAIFKILADKYNIDFSQYKQTTILRRIEKRINALDFASTVEYYQYLKNTPAEASELFNTMLIGVTEFFRDNNAFESFKQDIKKLILNNSSAKNIRIWSVGCASGEEPYSIAIAFHELLGDEIENYQLQIFATDVHEKSLINARKGIYEAPSLEQLPPSIIKNYFEKKGERYEIKKTIKQHILFSKHDITNDPPFVKLDIITCRNLLIYFNNKLQREALRLFNYALNDGGLLFLGKSESVGIAKELFTKVNEHKLFRKQKPSIPFRPKLPNYRQKLTLSAAYDGLPSENQGSIVEMAKETLYYTFEHPFVVINDQAEIKEVKGSLRLYMEVSQGSMSSNLLKMANKELVIEIRSLLAQAKKTDKPKSGHVIKFSLFGADHFVKLKVVPFLYAPEDANHYIVIFERIDPDANYLQFVKKLSDKDFVDYRVKELEQKVLSQQEQLQTFTEELETSNEELQSINEELQSANEELKSTNEELETSNEELQSANEELQTANQELRIANTSLIEKEKELKAAKREIEKNAFLYRKISENIPNGTIGILNGQFEFEYVAGQDMAMFAFEGGKKEALKFEDLIPGKNEKKRLNTAFSRVLDNQPVNVEFKLNDRVYALLAIPLQFGDDSPHKILYLTQDITDQKKAEEALKQREEQFRTLAETLPQLVWVTDQEDHCEFASTKWIEYFDGEREDGLDWQHLVHPKDQSLLDPTLHNSQEQRLPFFSELRLKKADDHYTWHLLQAVPQKNDEGEVIKWIFTFTNISEQKLLEQQKDDFIKMASHELKTPITSIKIYIQLLRKNYNDSKDKLLSDSLATVDRQINKLTALISELLNVNNIKAGKLDLNKSIILINDLIGEAIEDVKVTSSKHQIKLVDNDEATIVADKEKIMQVIINLLTNAIKYSPQGGDVIVRVKTDDKLVIVSIKDFGIGIDRREHSKIFKNFYRVKGNDEQTFPGFGIGLYIVREIVVKHGGDIWMESEKGKGSEFFFSLPLASGAGEDKKD